MLQDDLDSVCEWEKWHMTFNTEKYKVVHYDKGSINFNTAYTGNY